ncbi:nicotinamide-nucleotide amidase [Pantoea sp. A4]|uniref:nicotinamide-nucleotide amidase n=1 Tax=Pantoea sp. A4 TaxID=1225184 RepID=UPI00037461FE|nr:nicotinamide-nucleotide amidase [Pantoea sp. A4]
MDDHQLMALSHQIGQLLKQHSASVTVAESCTGGWLAKVLTDISGSSAWFERGFVTYSNQAKAEMLGVQTATLERFGAVSEEVVKEMARGAQQQAQAQYAISVSGIAGPDGGTTGKPVGTVWFGFALPGGKTVAYRQCFSGDREAVRRQSVFWALSTLHSEFLKN